LDKTIKMRNYIPIIILVFLLSSCHSSRNISSTNLPDTHYDRFVAVYVSRYADQAMSEMQRTGVPASITLAQGMIESDYGRSRLATEANNHFGIKCHSDWQGGKIYHDDDRRRECFRKYNRVEDSFLDHSDFLMNGTRYSFLFDLPPDDYKEWARGLKKAGYATNPKYASMLINMIEENMLYLYDRQSLGREERVREVRVEEPETNDELVIASSGIRVGEKNRIQYIVINENDTYESIIEEFGLMSWELFRYNDLDDEAEPVPGQIIYLQPKRNRAEVGNDYHIVKEGETMHSISQKYGIKLKVLYEKNHILINREPVIGTELWLRRTKPEGL